MMPDPASGAASADRQLYLAASVPDDRQRPVRITDQEEVRCTGYVDREAKFRPSVHAPCFDWPSRDVRYRIEAG